MKTRAQAALVIQQVLDQGQSLSAVLPAAQEKVAPRDRALLVDVTHDKNARPGAFRQMHQPHRAVFDLRDRAGRRRIIGRKKRLNRVRNQNVGVYLAERAEYFVEVGFRQDI